MSFRAPILLASLAFLAACSMPLRAPLASATRANAPAASANPSATADEVVALRFEGTRELPADLEEAPSPVPSRELAPTSHRVAAGDTLTKIADRYGVSVSVLVATNALANPDHLEIGQVIQLPAAPIALTAAYRSLPDNRLVRSVGAADFDVAAFIQSQPGALRVMSLELPRRSPSGVEEKVRYSAARIVERVSLEYSVDPRALLAALEYFAGLLTQADAAVDKQLYPLIAKDEAIPLNRVGLYSQLSWLADRLNRGYYDWKYRGVQALDFPDGARFSYDIGLNAASAALQYALAQLRDFGDWQVDIGESGFAATYSALFGDPFADAFVPVPPDLTQPEMTLPFARGEIWRFTGGFHGGWGNGSGWSAVDFSPPPENRTVPLCYVSSFPALAVADGVIARLGEGLVVLDLDGDGDEGSGWTVLYLHIDAHQALREGQAVARGNILGYPSCSGGVTNATHLHIARRYNGEWIPADCNRCRFDQATPAFVMSGWRVVGLNSQLYQGFMTRERDGATVVAQQGRFADINAISW